MQLTTQVMHIFQGRGNQSDVNLKSCSSSYFRGLPYTTSAEKGEGVKKCSKYAYKQYIGFVVIEGEE